MNIDKQKLPILTFITHASNNRSDGEKFLVNKLKSILDVKEFIREVVIIDNQSTQPLVDKKCYQEFIKEIKTTSIRIDDQMIKGVSGAWNLGIKTSFDLGAEFVINSCDDCVLNKTIEEFVKWQIENNQRPVVTGPITDDFGTGDRLRKMSNTKFAKVNNINIQDISSFNKPHFEKEARETWDKADGWVIDAINSRNVPWLNAFCFTLNRKAYQKIIDWRQGHEDTLFTVGPASKKNVDKFGVIKSKWGGQEYSFEAWNKKLDIDLKIIGNWYVPHYKDTSGLWRKNQNNDKAKENL